MIIKVEGMNCKHCEMRVKQSLKELGVKKIKINLETGEVSYKEHKKVNNETIKETINNLGYQVVE